MRCCTAGRQAAGAHNMQIFTGIDEYDDDADDDVEDMPLMYVQGWMAGWLASPPLAMSSA